MKIVAGLMTVRLRSILKHLRMESLMSLMTLRVWSLKMPVDRTADTAADTTVDTALIAGN